MHENSYNNTTGHHGHARLTHLKSKGISVCAFLLDFGHDTLVLLLLRCPHRGSILRQLHLDLLGALRQARV